jgi:activator of 2-hydroxyglutaryl-CoA dehydratase
MEVIAMALACGVAEFGALAQSAERGYAINSTCTVFAESEVVGLIARGIDRREVARGVVDSIAVRTSSLAKRVGLAADVLFIGGVALNAAMREVLAKRLEISVHVPEDPQMVAAIGCALLANETCH